MKVQTTLNNLIWESPSCMLGLSILLGYVLFVWFRTNVFVEYVNLFRLSRFFYVADFNKLTTDGYNGSYLDFLKEYYYEQFFVRLVSCPICLGFWLSLIVVVFSNCSVLLIPFTLCFYGFFNKLL